MKLIQVRIPNGEIVTYRETDDGQAVCPVCGLVGGEGTTWVPAEDGGDATPTLDICPCCRTQYGYDDPIADFSPVGQQEKNWHTLRLEWLARERWSSKALNQLRNLGIDPNELEKHKPK